jgi:PAS domain S-box-containing protein
MTHPTPAESMTAAVTADPIGWLQDDPHLPDVLDATSCLVLVTEVDTGVVVGVNRAAEAVTGFARAEMVGRPIWEKILFPDDRDGARAAYGVPHGGGIPLAYEGAVQTKSGGARKIYWSNDFLLQDGVRSHIVGTGIDVTGEASTPGLFGHLMRTATGTAFIGTDLQGIVTSCSLGAEQMTGYSFNELMGSALPQGLFEPEQLRSRAAEEASTNLEVILGDVEQPEQRRDWTVYRKDGRRLTASIAISRVTDYHGEPIGYFAVGSDVTEERRARDSLEAALEKERQAVEQLQQLDDIKSEVIETVSHEVRTPLSAITASAELLLDGAAGTLTPHQVKLIDVVRRNAERLATLAADLDVLSGAHAGQLAAEKRRIDLCDVVVASEGFLRDMATHRRLTTLFEVPDHPVLVHGSSTHLAQILRNLAGNAIKFTEDGGTVTCTLTTTVDEAVLEVRDTGVGISQDEQHGMFDEFFRSTGARAAVVQGTGMGLPAVAAIVQLHGGTIACDSALHHGTIFTVRLPLDPTIAADS